MRVINAMLERELADAAPIANGWHRNAAPQDTPTPYGVFRVQSPSVPRYTQGGRGVSRRIESLVYLVKVVFVGESGIAPADALTAADARLNQNTGLAVAGHTLSLLRRIGGVDFEEDEAGKRYQHLGHLYRIEVQPA